MRKVSFGIACFISIAVLVILSTDSGAFQGFDNGGGAGVPACAACHPDLANLGPDHGAHAALSNNDCNSCHAGGAGNNNPPLANCVRCHGRDADGNPSADFSAGLGRGLRQHHVTVGAAACGNCHNDTVNATTGSAPENVLPSFYPQALGGAGLDPCDGSEEQFPSNSISLDNDGDGLTDGADADCQAVGVPTISIAPPSKDYGNVAVGGSSSQVFTISNTGTADLTLTDGVLSDPTNFTLDLMSGEPKGCGDQPPPIAPGDNCTVSIAFNPTLVADFTEMITVTSDDTANSPLDVPLTGSGVLTAPDIAVTPASIDYGNVNVGSTATREVTISNAGDADLNVSGIILSDNTVIHTLDLGGGANPCVTGNTVIVPLDGAQAGTTSTGTGTATITYDEATNLLSWDITYGGLSGPVTVAHFHGPAVPGVNAGVQVPITVTASPLIGSATITDAQEADLFAGLYYVNIHTAANPGGEIRGQVTAPVTIPASGNCTVEVTFIPPAAGGPFPATLTVNSDDSDSPSTVVSITGMGSTPATGGGGGGGCSVIGSGGHWGGGAVLFLTLLAILVTLRRQRAIARR